MFGLQFYGWMQMVWAFDFTMRNARSIVPQQLTVLRRLSWMRINRVTEASNDYLRHDKSKDWRCLELRNRPSLAERIAEIHLQIQELTHPPAVPGKRVWVRCCCCCCCCCTVFCWHTHARRAPRARAPNTPPNTDSFGARARGASPHICGKEVRERTN